MSEYFGTPKTIKVQKSRKGAFNYHNDNVDKFFKRTEHHGREIDKAKRRGDALAVKQHNLLGQTAWSAQEAHEIAANKIAIKHPDAEKDHNHARWVSGYYKRLLKMKRSGKLDHDTIHEITRP